MTTPEITPLEKSRGPLPRLKPADIVLVHIRGSLLRALVRRITQSYWDHTTMIIYPQGENGLKHNIIIENVQRGMLSPFLLRGTEVHRLDKYFSNPQKYDIGIKRVSWLNDDHRQRIRSFLITNIDTPYWKLPLFKLIAASVSRWYRRRLLNRQRWSCSALVQKAYYESTANWQERLKLIFKEGDWSPIEMQDLTSPADIARSEKTVWIYNQH